VNPAGTVLEYATYLGSPFNSEFISDVSTGLEGWLYFTANVRTIETLPMTVPTGQFAQPRVPPASAPGSSSIGVIGRLNTSTNAFTLTTLGSVAGSAALHVSPNGTVWTAGQSFGNYPLTRPLQSQPAGRGDAVITLFTLNPPRRRWP
jgi:hypothetical protein